LTETPAHLVRKKKPELGVALIDIAYTKSAVAVAARFRCTGCSVSLRRDGCFPLQTYMLMQSATRSLEPWK